MIPSVPEHPDKIRQKSGVEEMVVVTHQSNNRIASPRRGNAYDLIGR